jgi:hypothetical protein
VAYNIITLDNVHQDIGSGMVGDMEKPVAETEFLELLQKLFIFLLSGTHHLGVKWLKK